MGFPDMPYPTLQPGYDVPLPWEQKTLTLCECITPKETK
jgi:hypothetical protein